MSDTAEEIKHRLDIADFLRGYIDLAPAGKNFKARCPFHKEKSPSFMVNRDRQIWHCFGCGEGGDIFKFLMKFENIEFFEALKILAEKAGVELKSLSPGDQRQFGVLYDINSDAKDFFVASLKKSEEAIKYLKERGLKKETVEEFEIGFAPSGVDKTTLYLLGKGHKIDDILRSGIALRTERGKYVDRFRNRIMFPIHNHFGRVVGFSGRVMPGMEGEDIGKYVNSPDSPIFNKSKLLYGFWQSKKFIRDTRAVFVVEGQMDFLMAWQDGVKEVVATSGTALTPDHLKSLRLIADKVVIGFDSDEAGLMAAERGIDLLGSHDFNVFVFTMDRYKDPAEAVMKEPGFLAGALSKAKLAFHHYFDRYIKHDLDIAKKKRNIRVVLQKIQKLKSNIDQANWLSELAHKTGIPEKDLRMEMAAFGEDVGSIKSDDIGKNNIERKLNRIEIITERVLALAYARREFVEGLNNHLEYVPLNYVPVYNAVFENQPPETTAIKELVNLIILKSGMELADEEIAQDQEFKVLLKELQLEYLKNAQDRLRRDILKAETHEEEDVMLQYLKEFDDISKKMQDIRNQ